MFVCECELSTPADRYVVEFQFDLFWYLTSIIQIALLTFYITHTHTHFALLLYIKKNLPIILSVHLFRIKLKLNSIGHYTLYYTISFVRYFSIWLFRFWNLPWTFPFALPFPHFLPFLHCVAQFYEFHHSNIASFFSLALSHSLLCLWPLQSWNWSIVHLTRATSYIFRTFECYLFFRCNQPFCILHSKSLNCYKTSFLKCFFVCFYLEFYKRKKYRNAHKINKILGIRWFVNEDSQHSTAQGIKLHRIFFLLFYNIPKTIFNLLTSNYSWASHFISNIHSEHTHNVCVCVAGKRFIERFNDKDEDEDEDIPSIRRNLPKKEEIV